MQGEKADTKLSSNILRGIIFNRSIPVYSRIAGFAFRKIEFDNESLQTLEKYSKNDAKVFISFHSKRIAVLILYKLLKRNRLDNIFFVSGCSSFLLQSLGHILKRITRKFTESILRKNKECLTEAKYIEESVKNKNTILISPFSKKFFRNGHTQFKNNSIESLIDLQRRVDSPIYLFPQIIFWNMNPERSRTITASKATGNRGILSALYTVIKSCTSAFVRVSEPINLKEHIEKSGGINTDDIAAEILDKMLEIYNHEKRSVLGPLIDSQKKLMQKVVFNNSVQDEIKKISEKSDVSVKRLQKDAKGYFKEIENKFSISFIKFFIVVLDYIFKKLFSGISYDPKSIKRLRESMKKGSLVIVPSHRSHMDYLILSYVLFKNRHTMPLIAAGDNLSFFPMGFLFRNSGAFFMRRSFRGLSLYPAVFKQYLKTILSEGYLLEFFIEGGRTRTGKLLYPKSGLLNYLIESVEDDLSRDILFVPTSISYDRILEETSYLQEVKGGEKEKESFTALLETRKFLKRNHGSVYLNFNEPFSLKEMLDQLDSENNSTDIIAENIITKISEVVAVTPFALASTVMLVLSVKGFSKRIFLDKVEKLYQYFIFSNACIADSIKYESDVKKAVEGVIQSCLDDSIINKMQVQDRRRTVTIDDFYILYEEERVRISFYKNCIIYHLLPLVFICNAILELNKFGKISIGSIQTEYDSIRDIFSREFLSSNNIKDIKDKQNMVYKFLLNKSIIVEEGQGINISDTGIDDLQFYSKIIKDYLESYSIVLDSVLNLKNSLYNKNELLLEIRKNGIKGFHLGDIDLIESLSTPNYSNALKKLVSEKILKENYKNEKILEYEVIDIDKAQEMYNKIESYLANVR